MVNFKEKRDKNGRFLVLFAAKRSYDRRSFGHKKNPEPPGSSGNIVLASELTLR